MLRQNLPLKSSPVAAAVYVARTTDWCCSLSVLESNFSTSSQLTYCWKLLHQKSCQRWRTTRTTELLLRTDVLVLSGVIRTHFWVIIYDSGGRQQATGVYCPPSSPRKHSYSDRSGHLSQWLLKSLSKTWTWGRRSFIPTSKHGEEDGGNLI